MKKYVALLLILCLMISTFGLVGCGNGSTAKKTVKIAYIGPITGPSAALGLGMKNSAELAVRQANASGKLPYKLELLVLDDASDPAQAVNAANKAAADPDVVATLAHFNSGCALASVHTFHKNGLASVIISAIHNKITQNGYPEITRVIGDINVQQKVAGKKAVNEFGLKKYAVIQDQTDYGKSNAEAFMDEVKRNGAEVVSYDGISVGQQDYSSLLTNIKTKNPDAVFFGGLATEAALIKRQMSDLKINAVFLSDSGIISSTFNDIAKDAAQGTIAHGYGAPTEDLPGGQAFIKAYNEAGFKEPYEAYGPFAYDAANIIIEAIKKVGPDRAKLITAIKETKDFEGALGKTTFDQNGQTTAELVTTYISEKGKWVPYSKATLKVKDGKIQ